MAYSVTRTAATVRLSFRERSSIRPRTPSFVLRGDDAERRSDPGPLKLQRDLVESEAA